MAAPKLCVTVTGRTTAELRERRDQVANADLVELRVDSVQDPSAAGALAGRRTPVIFTCRPTWEGGGFSGSEEERKRILREAQRLGAEYVDIEWRAQFTDLIADSGGHGIVISMHDFAGIPDDLAGRAAAMRATGAAVVKVAVTPGRLRECFRLQEIACSAGTPMVVVGMGEAGLATRVLAARFGSHWTYAGDGVAPGQVPASVMLDRYAFRSLGQRTAIYGVVGRPVSHSISPAMHNAAFRAIHLDAVYLPLAAADFDDFLAFAAALPIEGASVTAPYKLEAYERADESDAVSRRIGAVNTLRRRDAGWVGCNTDVAGFLAPLATVMPLRGARVTVLGGGGAARAVGEALVSANATVSVSARRREQADAIARKIGAVVGAWPPHPGSWDLLVNATPVGTSPAIDESPMPQGPLTGQLVYDLVYNPPETQLLRDARSAGCRTIGGLDMLVAQAQRQFEWWTGIRAPERVMRNAALEALRTTI
jgi:3-dehydroquinate dehydratase/shikimate dehydrogenase